MRWKNTVDVHILILSLVSLSVWSMCGASLLFGKCEA